MIAGNVCRHKLHTSGLGNIPMSKWGLLPLSASQTSRCLHLGLWATFHCVIEQHGTTVSSPYMTLLCHLVTLEFKLSKKKKKKTYYTQCSVLVDNNTSKTDVAPWCYKWVGGLDGYLRVGVCIEHLTVLIKLEYAIPSPAPSLSQISGSLTYTLTLKKCSTQFV